MKLCRFIFYYQARLAVSIAATQFTEFAAVSKQTVANHCEMVEKREERGKILNKHCKIWENSKSLTVKVEIEG